VIIAFGMANHWADLPTVHDTESGIAAIEREQMTKPRPLETECQLFHQPSYVHLPSSNESYSEKEFFGNSMTLNTIKLIQYCHSLQTSSSSSLPEPVSLLPTVLKSTVVNDTYDSTIAFVHKDLESPFVNGVGITSAELHLTMCRHFLMRSVAAITMHAGFDGCIEVCLDTLTDVLDHYLRRIVLLFRASTDTRNDCGSSCYHNDVIQHAFAEIGIGKLTNLHDFYQTRLVAYQTHLLNHCKQLEQDVVGTTSSGLSDGTAKQTNHSVLEDCTSDINFPVDALEETCCSDHILSLDENM
jgi:STAGA complex 65 subunit gamma